MENIQMTHDSINSNSNPGDVDGPHNSENEGGAHYWQDCRQLLTLLPKEVWHLIGTFLYEKDIINLTNSSLFFRELFLKNRIFHLFLPILEILIPKLEHYMDHNDTTDIYYGGDYDELVRGVLLECRHSCKTWKQIIDKTASSMAPKIHKAKNLISYLLSKNFTFKNSWEIDYFMEYFQTSHPPQLNPSPARYIDLHIRLMEEDYPLLIQRITTLLNKCGDHIWTFQVSIMFGHENPVEFHQKLVEWLNHLPNLQNLTIFCFVPLRADNVEQVDLELLPRKLNNLRKLSVETFVAPLQDESIPQWSWMDRYNFSKFIDQHDNLNTLEITIFNKLDLNILERVRSPLKALVVQFYCKEDDVNLSEVFNLLSEKFSESLENLRVTFRVNNRPSAHMKVIRDCFNGRVNLPKVRNFEINILRIYFLDFLLGMKENLEELVINCAGLRGYENGDFSEVERSEIELMEGSQIIKSMGYQDKILESNVWSIFPKLKEIGLVKGDERKEFKREDWRIIQSRV